MLALTALAALLPALVAGQDSSSAAAVASAAASVPGCALTCTLSLAGSSTCGGVSNITCLCTDQTFQRDVYQCYVNTCSESDLQAAAAYGAQTCETVGVTLNISAVPSGVTGLPTSSGSSSAGSSAASTSGSTTSAPASSSSASSGTAAPASTSPSGGAAGTLVQGSVLISTLAALVGAAGLAVLL